MAKTIIIDRNENAPKLQVRVTYRSGRISHHKDLNSAKKAIRFYAGKDAIVENRLEA